MRLPLSRVHFVDAYAPICTSYPVVIVPRKVLLAHHRRGSGPPLVLVHGIGSQWQVWTPVLDRLAREREVIAVDLPGFGDSPALPRAPTVRALAEAVAEFVGGLGVERAAVAGNSLGGGIALELGRLGAAASVCGVSPIGFQSGRERTWSRDAGLLAPLGATGRGERQRRLVRGRVEVSAAGRRSCRSSGAHPYPIRRSATARRIAAAPRSSSSSSPWPPHLPPQLHPPGPQRWIACAGSGAVGFRARCCTAMLPAASRVCETSGVAAAARRTAASSGFVDRSARTCAVMAPRPC